ncbi:MAG: GAF domain-containing sensor histidine kinase [Chloroflexi bacterium]|nr:GAF domain-containing sensor histidine kinase [Chloroflexota bacterium]MBI1855954.1 GAF domain-containing sensor histidine kinase [Chloroflexota bacterium]MBI3338537.1 GAF domain-containing sensor histidine kinase [Chloroflexota bacterium]
MRTYETPYIADWFAISLRWTVMIGFVVSLALGGELTLALFWPIAVMIFWNMLVTVLASLSIRLPLHRQISLAVDILLSGVFFWVQGGLAGPAAWTGLMPIFSGIVYFELLGGLMAAILSAALAIGFAWLFAPLNVALAMEWGGIYAVLGLLFGFIGKQLMSRLRISRQKWLDAEDKSRHIQGERLRAIYELTSALTATLSYKRVLDSALDLGYTALNPDSDAADNDPLVSAILLFRGGQLRVGSARRFTSADSRVTFQGSEGILKKVFDEGEPAFSKDIGYDPELGRVIAFRNCTSGYCFPLRSGFNVYGAMVFAHPDPNYFSSDRRDLLDIIGRQAVVAIQNARLYQDLVEEKERMVEVHEEARKKLARDLHDGPTQSVAAMAMRINIARRMMEKDSKGAVDELSKIEELAHRTTKEIRHMLFTLRPLILESQGLSAALKAMADKMRETYTQNVIVNVDDDLAGQMEMGKQGVVFYIIEEAVNNARKHANAPNIWVRLRPFQQSMALLEIEDDGVGFDVDAVNKAYDKRSSLGMVNLRERTELVNGLLNLKSTIGKGTNISVYIPLTEEAADRLHHAKSR